jgi:NhaP-type Na+/H+ and K+/H+ antiporter
MFLDVPPTVTLDWSLILAVIALVVSVVSALFTGWEVLVFRRMSELEKQEYELHKRELDLQEKEFAGEKERFLFRLNVNTTVVSKLCSILGWRQLPT